MKFKWIEITVLTYFCSLIDGIASNLVGIENLPGYAVTNGIKELSATRCRTEMEQFRDAISHRILWSLTMLDSSGQPSSGYIMGNNYWTGSKSQCDYLRQKQPIEYSHKRAANNSLYRNPAEEFPPFMVNFFGAYIRHNGTMQYHFSLLSEDVIVLGLCLPDSCTEHEVATMLNEVFDNRLLLFGHLYSTDFKLIKVSNLKDNYTWLLDGKIMLIIAILVALFGTVVVSTWYDIFLYQKRLQKREKFRSNWSNMTELKGNAKKNPDYDPVDIVQESELEAKLKDDKEQKPEHNPKTVQKLKPASRMERILVSFSIASNVKQILQLKTSSEDIAMFHGIKFIGASWLIILHTIWFTIGTTGNRKDIHVMSRMMQYQLFANGVWAVDVFFFLAGFLLTVGHLKSQRKKRKIVSVGKNAYEFLIKIIKRFIRLTPPYAVTMLLSILIFSWSNNLLMGPMVEPIPEQCLKYWWRNILYIHNLFDWNSMCMTWSWHVSNDMQFYIFSTFILKLSVSHYYIAVSLSVVTLILSMLSAGYTTYEIGHVKTLDSTLETLPYIYIQPWIRIIPYIVAMGTALFLEKWNYKLHLSKKGLGVGWFISILCYFLIIYGPVFISTSTVLSIVYETFGRLCWNLAIAWPVIVCLTNNAATLNQFLSLPCWIPLSRVSYCVYLLNPIFVLLLSVLSDYTIHAEVYFYLVASFGIWTITFVCAFILSAATEVPVKLLLRVISSSITEKK